MIIDVHYNNIYKFVRYINCIYYLMSIYKDICMMQMCIKAN
jgi:hypothetical protein